MNRTVTFHDRAVAEAHRLEDAPEPIRSTVPEKSRAAAVVAVARIIQRHPEALRRPTARRTFEQAVAYAVSRGMVWMIYSNEFYNIVNGRAVKSSI